MNLYKVDTIVKAELMRHGLTMHDYVKRAYLAMRFIRTINFDSAYYVKSTTETIVNNKISIPADFIGLVRIGIKNGQYLERLGAEDALIDNTVTISEDDPVYGFKYWYPNTNKYAENYGGYFGYNHLSEKSYKILYTENKILINANVSAVEDEVYLQYNSDGMETGKAGHDDGVMYIHPYSVDAMIAWMDWQALDDNNRFVAREAKKNYYNELRKYRARINPTTDIVIRRLLRGGYYSSPKN